MGGKKNPLWRVVVADQRAPRDGRVIEFERMQSPSECSRISASASSPSKPSMSVQSSRMIYKHFFPVKGCVRTIGCITGGLRSISS